MHKIERAQERGAQDRADGKGKRILIVRLDRIGDVLLSTPVIKAIRDAYPDTYIAMMVRRYAKDILEGNPYLDEVIIYEKTGRERSLAGNLKFLRSLRRRKFDAAFLLHPTRRSHVVTALAGIPHRIGYGKKWGFLLTEKIPHTKHYGLKHEIEYVLDVLRYTGLEPKEKKLYMPVNPAAEKRVEEMFEENGIAKGDLCIAINPGASCRSKRWSPSNFAKVADAIIEKYGAKVIVLAGSGDKEFGDKVFSAIKRNCVNLSGKTTLADVASVLRRVKLFISNDSGPVHIACAVGTPVVSIFGRSDRGLSPKRWGPTGERDIVVHKDVGCIKCFAHNCKRSFHCLQVVTVEDVLAAAEQILG